MAKPREFQSGMDQNELRQQRENHTFSSRQKLRMKRLQNIPYKIFIDHLFRLTNSMKTTEIDDDETIMNFIKTVQDFKIRPLPWKFTT